jgi:hypothetical protein
MKVTSISERVWGFITIPIIRTTPFVKNIDVLPRFFLSNALIFLHSNFRLTSLKQIVLLKGKHLLKKI